jgi:hypothetical protein
MPTYIVGDIHVSDPASYQAHLPRALATIANPAKGMSHYSAW